MKKIIFLVALIFSQHVVACLAPPEEQHVDDLELIKRTGRIVLAKVISANVSRDNYSVIYKFKVIKSIKGSVENVFSLEGHPLYEGEMKTFDHHSDPGFWSRTVGRMVNEEDCEIHPSFSVGVNYLVFLDRPYHSKSFERIERTRGDSSMRDRWLQYVEKQVNLNKASKRIK